jgi:RNA polymerase sigma-70 factor (ECF subfamily)
MSRLAARLAPDADRDDVVQEALARAWAKRRQLDPERGALSSWLLAITADQAAKARRRCSVRWQPCLIALRRHTPKRVSTSSAPCRR